MPDLVSTNSRTGGVHPPKEPFHIPAETHDHVSFGDENLMLRLYRARQTASARHQCGLLSAPASPCATLAPVAFEFEFPIRHAHFRVSSCMSLYDHSLISGVGNHPLLAAAVQHFLLCVIACPRPSGGLSLSLRALENPD